MPAARRFARAIGIWGGGAVVGVLVLIAVLWTWLPRWAPLLVIEHSPWLEPAARAYAWTFPDLVGTPESNGDPGPLRGDDSVGFQFLMRVHDEPDLPSLATLLRSDDARLRIAVLSALIIVEDELALAMVQSALDDRDPWVRLHALGLLLDLDSIVVDSWAVGAGLDTRGIATAAAQAVAGDEDPVVRAHALAHLQKGSR